MMYDYIIYLYNEIRVIMVSCICLRLPIPRCLDLCYMSASPEICLNLDCTCTYTQIILTHIHLECYFIEYPNIFVGWFEFGVSFARRNMLPNEFLGELVGFKIKTVSNVHLACDECVFKRLGGCFFRLGSTSRRYRWARWTRCRGFGGTRIRLKETI